MGFKPIAAKLSKRALVKALFSYAASLVCSTKAKVLSLMKATKPSTSENKEMPEIGGYVVVRHWSNELADTEDIAFLIQDKAEAYRVAKERYRYFSVREAARHNPLSAEDRPDLPHGNVGVTWATVEPVTKALFDMLQKNDPCLQFPDASWLGTWTCKINGKDIACAPEEDPYERVDTIKADASRSHASGAKAMMKRLFKKRSRNLEP